MCEIIKLNPFRARSFNSFAMLVKELISTAYKNILDKEDLEEIFSFINVKSFRKASINNGDEYYLIKSKEKEAGFFQIRQVEDSLDIARIFIKKEFQNQKIGYKAFLKIIDFANKKNLKKITIYVNKDFKETQQAIQKWGFKGEKLTARYIGCDKYLYEYYYEYEL